MLINKEFKFAAAHKLKHDGKCKNLHGHTYKLRVTLEGEINKEGFVMDFAEISQIVTDYVISKLDHGYLNDIIEQPTAENLVLWVRDQLINKVNLYELSLWETETSFVTLKK